MESAAFFSAEGFVCPGKAGILDAYGYVGQTMVSMKVTRKRADELVEGLHRRAQRLVELSAWQLGLDGFAAPFGKPPDFQRISNWCAGLPNHRDSREPLIVATELQRRSGAWMGLISTERLPGTVRPGPVAEVYDSVLDALARSGVLQPDQLAEVRGIRRKLRSVSPNGLTPAVVRRMIWDEEEALRARGLRAADIEYLRSGRTDVEAGLRTRMRDSKRRLRAKPSRLSTRAKQLVPVSRGHEPTKSARLPASRRSR